MKTTNGRGSGIPRFIIIGAVLLSFGYVAGFATLFPETEFKSEEQSKAIQDDISAIAFHNDAVQVRKENLKESRQANDRAATILARQELCKSKADLKRDKAHLRADRTALVRLHQEKMDQTYGVLMDEKSQLKASKRQLKTDLRRGNTICLTDDAREVANNQKELNQAELALSRQEYSLESELAAIDKQLDQANNRGTYASNDSPREKFLDFFGAGNVDNEPVALK